MEGEMLRWKGKDREGSFHLSKVGFRGALIASRSHLDCGQRRVLMLIQPL